MAGFENPVFLVAALLAAPAVYAAVRNGRFNRLVGSSRLIIILLLAAAAASPYVTADQEVLNQPTVTVLEDSSRSTELMEQGAPDFKEIRVNREVIASGNSSDLEAGFLRNLEPNTAYLAVSDFRSTQDLEGVATAFNRKNSTLYAMKPPMEDEAAVTVKGPETTVPGAENIYRVKVYSTGKKPEPEVTFDGSPAALTRTGNSTWKLEKQFEEKGSHTITASIGVNDRWSRNNRFYKSIEVTEKPRILVIGERGAMADKLEQFYRVETARELPENLEDFYTVIVKKGPVDRSRLTDYVTRGNGLVYTGDYGREMDVLPVKRIPGDQQAEGAKIILLIDISVSTEEEGKVKRAKKIAYNLVEKLPFNNKAGLVAYNTEAYRVSEVKPLATHRDSLKDRIARLETSGNSFHHVGLKGAKSMLNGTGNIIMITDGKISSFGRERDTESKTRRIADNLETRLITVGVGDKSNRGFLKDIAERGNGFFLDAEESGRLKFVFRGGGATGGSQPLTVTGPEHFVTEGLMLSSSTPLFDPVEPKAGADLLVASTSGKPFLTSWRYGIGRVAAFSGGTRDLTGVMGLDPVLVSRTVSWTVGDPERKKEKRLEVEPSRVPDKPRATASYKIDGFRRQGENLYTRDIDVERPGIHSIENEIYSYNYNREIEEVGYSPEMEKTVRATGGEVFEPGDKQEIKNEVKKFSNREIETRKRLSGHLIIAALLVFLSEVAYRKRQGKR